MINTTRRAPLALIGFLAVAAVALFIRLLAGDPLLEILGVDDVPLGTLWVGVRAAFGMGG